MSSGLRARQVVDLQHVNAEEWERARNEYKEWRKQMEVLSTPLLFVGGGGAGYLAYWLWPRKGLLRSVVGWCLVMIAFYALRALIIREQHWEIYRSGYEAGHTDGVNKALKISEKDDEIIHDIIRDEEIDEIVKRKRGRPST
jgi:hypothetical protein